MIKIENIDVYGFESAIRGMRNPLNSWDRMDSYFTDHGTSVGENDLDLMQRLFKGGTEHRKYLRFIDVTMDITAPLYWWKEFDTYKVGTVANSCSTMHKIHAKEFTIDDFSHEHLVKPSLYSLMHTIDILNYYKDLFVNGEELEPACQDPTTRLEVHCMTKKDAWNQMIQLLPTSYNQKRTVKFNYEVAVRIIEQRKGHKLDEWHELVNVLIDLPYMKQITRMGE